MCRVRDRHQRPRRIEYRSVSTSRRPTARRAARSGRHEERDLSEGSKNPAVAENLILSHLPRKEYARLAAALTRVSLKSGQVLYEPGAAMHWAYFPDSALISILSLAEDGTSLETSLIGHEGLIGIPIVLRSNSVPYRVVVQSPGIAWKMKAEVLRKEFDRCQDLHRFLLYYLHTLIVQLAQSGACNRFHTTRQRLSRWLLA